MEKAKITQVTFGGMVFMYGNMQIIADKGAEKVVLTKWAGADGFTSDKEVRDVDINVFDKLVEAIESVDYGMAETDDNNTFIAVEEEEETGAYEWYVAVGDGENIVFCLRGTNPESEIFKVVSKKVEDACVDFGCINAFFRGVNE